LISLSQITYWPSPFADQSKICRTILARFRSDLDGLTLHRRQPSRNPGAHGGLPIGVVTFLCPGLSATLGFLGRFRVSQIVFDAARLAELSIDEARELIDREISSEN
jgi:hypothetical protein